MFYACADTNVQITGCYTNNGNLVTASGDQYLRLFDESGNQVAYSDDGRKLNCGRSSYISYTTTGQCQTYFLHQGCYGTSSCSSQVVIFELDPSLLTLSYCWPGFYLSETGDACIQCAVNTYSSGYDDVCKSCPSNSYSPVGSSSCICSSGYTESGFGDSLACTSCGTSFIYTQRTCPTYYTMLSSYSYNPKCYLYDRTQFSSYGDALYYCNANNGWLVTVGNQAENALIYSLSMGGSVGQWIGMNDARLENSFNWVHLSSSYRNFSVGEPNSDDCVQQNSGGSWNVDDCRKSYPYVCEANPINTCQSTSSSSNKVPLRILCDNYCNIYVNGLYVGYSESWRSTATFTPTVNPGDVVAIEALDTVESSENYSGFAVTLSYPTGDVYSSPSTWRCIATQTTSLPNNWNLNSYDDSSWSLASSYGYTSVTSTIWGTNDMNNQAEWIWTSDNYNNNHIMCRFKPSAPSASPTIIPSLQPSQRPTSPTIRPSLPPSRQPSLLPTLQPTCSPSTSPSQRPTSPTMSPSRRPTSAPSKLPTLLPTRSPTNPTSRPSRQPSSHPTNPTSQPTSQPTNMPTLSLQQLLSFTVELALGGMSKLDFLMHSGSNSSVIESMSAVIKGLSPEQISISKVEDITYRRLRVGNARLLSSLSKIAITLTISTVVQKLGFQNPAAAYSSLKQK